MSKHTGSQSPQTSSSSALRIPLNGPQSAALEMLGPGNTLTLPWGRGVGKSWFQRFVWYYLVSKWDGVRREGHSTLRGVRIVLLAPTRKQAADVHARLMMQELDGPEAQWRHLRARVDRSIWRVEFPGGSWIQFFGADSADYARGLRVDCVATDEADDVDMHTYDSVVEPWFSEPWSLKMRILGGTPKRGRKGLLYRQHNLGVKGSSGYFTFPATYVDAPEQVDQQHVARLKETTPAETFSREWECNFDASEGLVYNNFYEHFHVRELPPGIVWNEVIVGVDHGYEDPGVILVIGIQGSGRDAVAWALYEVYEQHKTLTWWKEQVREIAGWYPTARWYADPSRPDTIEEYRRAGATRIEGAANAIDDGVAVVLDRLVIHADAEGNRWSRLYVLPTCKNTIHEFGNYRRKRDPRDPDHITEQFVAGNDHALDSLRYAVFTRFGGVQPVKGGSDSDARQ